MGTLEKHSGGTKSDDAKPGVMRVFSIQLATNVSDWVERVASAKGLTAEQQLGELITERARIEIEPLDMQLRLAVRFTGKLGTVSPSPSLRRPDQS